MCRGVEIGPQGEISLQNVLEIVPLEKVPGDAGPLTFVAFVRHLPAGGGEGAFVLRAEGSAEPLGRLPLRLEVPAAGSERQLALRVTLPSVSVGGGGWFEVAFEWAGQTLATNRFAIAAVS